MMDRSLLHRGFCIPHQNATDLDSIKTYSEMLIEGEIGDMNLSSEVQILGCDDNQLSMTSYDELVIITIMVYSGMILFATLYSLAKTKDACENRFISIFSLQQNWRKRTSPINNADYKKMKSIQGIRFFTLLLVMIVHVKLSYGMIYLENPAFLEQASTNRIMSYINISDVFIVKPYFMFSSWLLTVQILHIYKNHGMFSLTQVGIVILNRYCRIAVLVGVLIAVYNTSIIRFAGGPHFLELAISHSDACRNNWLQSLLFINNFQFLIDMCNPVTWYLSADFQMYVFNTLIFYMIIKYKLNALKTFGVLMTVTSVLYGTIIFLHDMNIIFKPSIRDFEYRILSRSMQLFITYQSTLSIFGCSIVGVILGLLYFENKDKTVGKKFLTKLLWYVIFLGLPPSVILISIYDYRGICAAILGPLVKPLYVLGIGIGILGMSHGMGGTMKKICESRIVEIMGNFNYSIYLCHLMLCMHKSSMSPIELGYFTWVSDYLEGAVKSIAVGIITTLMVEEPGIAIQKILLPQIKKYGGIAKNQDKRKKES